jgi:hypothetical protein
MYPGVPAQQQQEFGADVIASFPMLMINFATGTFQGNVIDIVSRPTDGAGGGAYDHHVEFDRRSSTRLLLSVLPYTGKNTELYFYVHATGQYGLLCANGGTTSSVQVLDSLVGVANAAQCNLEKATFAGTRTSKPRTPFRSPTATLNNASPKFTVVTNPYLIRRKFRFISVFLVALLR